ncbi:MAG: hypothetical protein JNJ77_17405 [Planctomycetia bacterium]|nr:hypothetical protein [Planctomycetia bacterium]
MHGRSHNQAGDQSSVEDCINVLDFIGGVTLCSASDNSGPYVIRVGRVPVATFGLVITHNPDEKPDPKLQLQQTQAAEIALLAFKLVRQRISSALTDPSQLREMVRAACRHARLSFLASRRQQATHSSSNAGIRNSYTSHKPGFVSTSPVRSRPVTYRPYT